MARTTVTYDLLISCPEDINDEIEIIREVVDTFNKIYGDINNIRIEARHWSRDSYPQSGGKPQELLNSQIVEKCDIAVGVLWTRFGTPTDEYSSGTEEEIEKMLGAKKQVFLYFSKKEIDPSKIDFEQYKKVIEFKEKYKNKGIYWEYSDIDEFKKLFLNHLSLYFLKTINKMDVNSNTNSLPELCIRGKSKEQILPNLVIKNRQHKVPALYKKSIEKIADLIREISSIQLAKVCREEKVDNSNNDYFFASNRYDSRLYPINPFINSSNLVAVTLSEDEKMIIINYAKEKEVLLTDDFFYLGDLMKPSVRISPLNILNNTSSFSGSDESKKKYELLIKLISEIEIYTELVEYFNEIFSHVYVEGVVSNIGKSFDEDIDIQLIFPKGCLYHIDEIPIPGQNIIQDINLCRLAERVFISKNAVNIQDYSEYPSDTTEISYKHNSIYKKSAEEIYEDEKTIY